MVELAEIEEHLKSRMGYSNVTDLKLIYHSTLTASDVNKDQSRLAISRNKVLTPFLAHYEDLWLQWKTEDGSKTKIPVNVVVGSTKYQLTLSRWNHSQNNNNNNMIYGWNYVLNGGWNKLRVDNHLRSGDPIRVVSFRSHNDNIGFVLLPAPAN